MSRSGRLPAAAAILVSVTLATLAACTMTPARSPGTSSANATGAGGSTTTARGAITPTTIDPGHIVSAGPGPTTLPTEDAITPIRRDFDTGEQVAITRSGFEPIQLSASIGKPVVWTNESGSTQQITVVGLLRSPRIPPGAQFVWTPNFGGSIAYRSASGFHALLILQ